VILTKREKTLGLKQEPPSNNCSHFSKLAKQAGDLFNNTWCEQVAAICYRKDDNSDAFLTLLITSRGTGRWIIPKGHAMKGKTKREVAAIEAYEEAGIKGRVSKLPIGQFSYIKEVEGSAGLPCIVDVFPMEVTAVKSRFKEHGQRELKWVPLWDAGRMVMEPELRGLFQQLDTQLLHPFAS
jgi:8-oxo-dGTP pyrophosphatase MutT (NUDIX family)